MLRLSYNTELRTLALHFAATPSSCCVSSALLRIGSREVISTYQYFPTTAS